MGFKTRTHGTAAQIGQTYKEEQREPQFGARRKASGSAQVPQNRSVDSMKAPDNSGGWKTMRSLKTRDEAVVHKNQLSSTPRRADQQFRVVPGSDSSYPFDVQYRKKGNTSARDVLRSKGLLPS